MLQKMTNKYKGWRGLAESLGYFRRVKGRTGKILKRDWEIFWQNVRQSVKVCDFGDQLRPAYTGAMALIIDDGGLSIFISINISELSVCWCITMSVKK